MVEAFKSRDAVSFCLCSTFTDQHWFLLSRRHLKIPSYGSKHAYAGFALQSRHDCQWIVGYINQNSRWYTSFPALLIQMLLQCVLVSSFPLHSCHCGVSWDSSLGFPPFTTWFWVISFICMASLTFCSQLLA